MPRRPRRQLWTEAACYHLINRGHNRDTVFASDGDRRYFLTLLARQRLRFYRCGWTMCARQLLITKG
jgi:hypothetical protein